MLQLYTATLLCGALLIALLGWQQRKCWQLIWQLNGWRGVISQPLLWIWICVYLNPNSILETISRLRRVFPRPIAVLVGTRVMLYIDDPLSMERILNAPECLDKTFMQDGFFARRGLLHARGQKWKLRRKQLNPAFSHNIVVSFFDVFNDVGNQLIEKFANSKLLHGAAVKYTDAEDMLSRAVLEVSCLTIMGTATSFTEADDANIATTYKRLLEISALKIVNPWLQIDFLHRLLSRDTYDESHKCNQLLEEFVAQIIERKHKAWQARAAGNAASANGIVVNADASCTVGRDQTGERARKGDGALEQGEDAWQRRIFIEQIFSLAATGELTLQDIVDEAQSMVLVSFETVSNSIIIALLCLAMERELNGDCQRRLREEIAQVLPHGGDTTRIDMTHLQQMKYLDAFLNETLRLLATVPINMRHVSRDFQLGNCSTPHTLRHGQKHKQQHEQQQKQQQQQQQQQQQSEQQQWQEWQRQYEHVTVPANTLIVLDTFNMQRDTTSWGPNAKQFEPQRFLEPTQQAQLHHSYSFLPFSKGLRTCIGRQYSFFMMKVFLVKLIAAFEFHTTQTLDELHFVEGISLKFHNADDIHFEIRRLAAAAAPSAPVTQ